MRAMLDARADDPAWRRRLAVSLVAWLVLVVVLVLILRPLRTDARVGAIALLMLLPPLAVTGNGPVPAALAAIATGLVFNFNFTHPYDSPRIESNASVAALAVYVVVALALSVLASRVREARALADRRAAAATLLQAVTVGLIRSDRLATTLRAGLDELVGVLQVRGATIDVAVLDEPITSGVAPGADVASFAIVAEDVALGTLRVDAAGEPLGADRVRVLTAFAGIVALALERARLVDERVRRRTLEETDRMRSALLQSVSHDLRTPLTAIKASASALLTAPPGPPLRDEMLADIEEQADRLGRLVANLLDLSRIEAGALRLHREQVPVDELIDDALTAARPFLAGVDVAVDAPAEACVVDADETMLRQVLVNLLANAARLDRSGQPLEVSALRTDGAVEIVVADHGPGVPDAERADLFVPFHRGRRGGSGLGLAISRGFVEAHGGELRFEETPGGGATFVVRMPVGAAEETA
jgi:two-component system, OmpR family, sensor histidine kinase KdpD